MGNTTSQKQRKIKNVLPQTEEEKKEMKKPHIVKPCPEMYPFNHIECDSKLENSTTIVVVVCQRVSLSVTGRMRGLNLLLLSSRQLSHWIFFVSAREAKRALFVITSTRSTSVSSFDFTLLHMHPLHNTLILCMQKKIRKVFSRPFLKVIVQVCKKKRVFFDRS